MIEVVLDFETASATDLKKAGAWRYAECPTTEILSLVYQFDKQEPRLWTPYVPDSALEDAAATDGYMFIAHNAGFEKAIWRRIMVELFGFPDVPNKRWHCTQAACAMRALPQDLDRAMTVLRLPHHKDKEGSKFTIALSKPNKLGQYDRSPEALQRVYDYNLSDIEGEVSLHERVGYLPPGERQVWLLDQRMNERGVRLDLAYVTQAQKIVDEASGPLLQEFATLTASSDNRAGLKPTQVQKVMAWIAARGVVLPNLKAETLKEILGDDEQEDEDYDELSDNRIFEAAEIKLPKDVHRALSIRKLIGSASIKKLARMQHCVCADGRARGLLQYHGAGPGLWAGRLFQPQNFPRGSIQVKGKDGKKETPPPQIVVDAIMSGDPDFVETTVGPAVETVVHSLRHAIIAAPGRALVAGDFAGIQARTVLALAGQHDKTELMANGADIYIDMAESIYKRKLNKKENPEERQIGKNCFAADTLVLTDRGIHPITQVTKQDRLWDGLQWVKHSGLLTRGLRPIINVMGVSATREHPVLCGEQWQPWEKAERDESIRSLALATGSKNLPSSATSTEHAVALPRLRSRAHAAHQHTGLLTHICGTISPRAAINVQNLRHLIGAKVIGAMQTLFQPMTIVSVFSIAFHPAYSVVTTPHANSLNTTVDAAYSSLSRGAQIAEVSCAILSRLTVGIRHAWNLIERTATKATNRTTFASLHARSTPAISDRYLSCRTASLNLKPVYDLANAGPRNRFTIITDRGPIIVHNSVLGLGFQMGAAKFRMRYAKEHPVEFAKNVVNVYRKEWAPLVPKVWYALDEAAVRAVWDRTTEEAYGIQYQLNDGWLTARLPSGRKIWYYNPRPIRKVMPWSTEEDVDVRQAWTSEAMKFGQWRTRDMFGGLLTENVVMGIQRDLLTSAMFKCEKEGLPIILNVHDEIITEPELSRADPKMLVQIMQDVPQWAKDMRIPVSVEAWAGERYRK